VHYLLFSHKVDKTKVFAFKQLKSAIFQNQHCVEKRLSSIRVTR